MIARAEDTPFLLNAAGMTGSGRAELVRLGAAKAEEDGLTVVHLRIDLDGWEPERTALADFLAYQAEKHGVAPLESAPQEDASFETALLASGALLCRDRERILAAGGLHATAAGLGDDERLLLDFDDLVSLPAFGRERVLKLAEENPRTAVAFATHPGDGHGKVARGREAVRIELMPLDSGELAGALELDAEDAERIRAASGGNRGVSRVLAAADGDPLEAALASVPEDRRKRLESFAHLAALCGENVPVHLLLDFLAVDAEERDDWIDLVDDHLGADAEFALFAERFQHPSFPNQPVYGFSDPSWADALRSRLGPESRTRLASDLLRAFVGSSPLDTRAAARLAVELGRAAGEIHKNDRMELERELGWWVGGADLERMREHLTGEIEQGKKAFALVWTTVNAVQFRWPATRTIALLEACLTGRVPESLRAAAEAIRSGLLIEAGQFAEAETFALKGVEFADDKLLESALVERLAAARRSQGREQQAAEDFARAHALRMELLEEGDGRVKPVLQQYAHALRANGREEEAVEIERRLGGSADR